MIRIGVKHDVVAVPQPIVAKGNIVRRDAEEVPIKPEAPRPSASQAIDVAGAKSSREMSVLPGMIQVVVSVISARVMTNPGIGPGVHVRRVWMSRLLVILPNLALRTAPSPYRSPFRRRSAAATRVSGCPAGATLCRTALGSCRRATCATLSRAILRSCRRPAGRRRRPMSRNMSAANRGRGSRSPSATRRSAATLLCKNRKREE